MMEEFLQVLKSQRWDDHRYYHQSRINQSLHLFSAVSFLCAYVLIFTNPVAAALAGWLAAMTTRQIGHFFFEPHGYDEVNHATHEYKEQVKVGYNLQRKVVLMSIWAFSPLLLLLDPTFFGIFPNYIDATTFTQKVAFIWLFVAAAGIIYRTVQLFFVQDVQTGLAWVTKILTDPFHDIKLYHMAPLYLLRGELFDSITPEHYPVRVRRRFRLRR
ncbi:MAG TPA: hypothetical protein VLZ74_09950 [Methylocella sp.]|nr:hypothetical protein [Methylocella sp.]